MTQQFDPRAQAVNRFQSLGNRLATIEQYNGEVTPMLRQQVTDFSNRPTGYNPLDDIQRAIEMSQGARDIRSSASQDQAQSLAQILQIDKDTADQDFRERQLAVQQQAQSKDDVRSDAALKLQALASNYDYDPKTGNLTKITGVKQLTEKQIEAETNLRKEFNGQIKASGLADVRDSYTRIENAQETGPGDVALVYAYMKMLDPTSVVREGEFATAEQAGGVPAWVVSSYNKAIDGQRLSPIIRQQFKEQAKTLYDAKIANVVPIFEHYGSLADTYGLDSGRVYGEWLEAIAGSPVAESRKSTPQQAKGADDNDPLGLGISAQPIQPAQQSSQLGTSTIPDSKLQNGLPFNLLQWLTGRAQ